MSPLLYLFLSLAAALVFVPIGYHMAVHTERVWKNAKESGGSVQVPQALEPVGRALWKVVGVGLMLLPGAAVIINILVLAGVITPVGE